MIRAILHFFTSLRIAVLLLLLLVLVSIIGTLVPQLLELAEYPRRFPLAGFWILALGFDDLYHGWLYLSLLSLVSLSAVVCTANRLTLTRNRWWYRLRRALPSEIRSLPVSSESVGDWAATNGCQDYQQKDCPEGEMLRFRCRGRAALLGGVLIHVGLVAILLGGLIDGFFGAEMILRGEEGKVVPVPSPAGLRSATVADRLRRLGRGMERFSPGDPRLPSLKDRVASLSQEYLAAVASPVCSLRFSSLAVEFHDPSDPAASSVKNWHSAFEILDGAGPHVVATGAVKVNAPFHFSNYSFFQADWSKSYDTVRFLVKPRLVAGEEASAAFEVIASVGARIKPEWASCSFEVAAFWPDFRFIQGEPTSVSDELNNPMAQVVGFDDQGNAIGRGWAFPEHLGAAMPEHAMALPYTFVVTGAMASFRTGIQVAHYPGTWLVWVGCFLFSIGMMCSFYIFYVEEWQVCAPDGNIITAVHGNRSRLALQEELRRLEQRI